MNCLTSTSVVFNFVLADERVTVILNWLSDVHDAVLIVLFVALIRFSVILTPKIDALRVLN